jgi:hypothetical protein
VNKIKFTVKIDDMFDRALNSSRKLGYNNSQPLLSLALRLKQVSHLAVSGYVLSGIPEVKNYGGGQTDTTTISAYTFR